jgi:hypothetical protein
MFTRLFLSCAALLLASCASGPSVLKKTAAADLGCPSKQLELEQLDKSRAGTTWLVTGCGKTAQYSVAKKNVTRTSEITAYTPPPAPPAPPSAEQQAQMQAFMDQHNQRMAENRAKRDEFFANNGQQPPPPPERPSAAPQPAPASPAPVAASSNYSGHVCLNDQYYACPDAESTMALGAYGSCKMKCMMGGSKCSSCSVGAGERCTREAQRDAECRKQ